MMKPAVADPAAERLSRSKLALIWLGVVVALAFAYWNRLDEIMRSPDDVMRLLEVRGLLNGSPWFNPHEARLDPPVGYDTHWSRLIDAGIAGLIIIFREFTSPDLAERLARCIWPLMVSGAAVSAVTAISARLMGSGAAIASFLIALTALVLYGTFRPGEIDHHNVQLALSLTMLACAVWCERGPVALAAGAAGGLLLSIGLEAAYIPIVVACTVALLMVLDPSRSAPALRFGFALAASTLVGYLAITPSAYRFVPVCDALGINSMAAVVLGGVGIGLVALLGARATALVRLLGLGAAALLAAGVFVALEPRCLKGPFGLLDPAIVGAWLDKVDELQSVPRLFAGDGFSALVYLAFPIVAIICAVWVARWRFQTPAAWAIVASFFISCAIAFGQNRALIYVVWLGIPFVAIVTDRISRLATTANLWRTEQPSAQRLAITRLCVALLVSPVVVAALAQRLTSAWAPAAASAVSDAGSCFKTDAYRTLATLPPGLVLASLDLGPSVLINTRHGVLAAPYHRIDRAILLYEDLMNGPPQGDEQRIHDRGINYVVTCSKFAGQTDHSTFEAALLSGKVGEWLQPVPAPDGDVLKIWRVAPIKISLTSGSGR